MLVHPKASVLTPLILSEARLGSRLSFLCCLWALNHVSDCSNSFLTGVVDDPVGGQPSVTVYETLARCHLPLKVP